MATIDYIYEVEGVPTDVDSIKLSDPNGTYGVRRVDTSAVVVADGTNMTRTSAGTYTYNLGAIPTQYEYYIEIIESNDVPDNVDYVHGFKAQSADDDLDATRSDLRVLIARYKGLNRDPTKWGDNNTADIDEIVKSGERMFYQPSMMPNEQSIHVWSFLNPVGEFALEGAYSTGTVDITTGTVTLTTGTWPSWAAEADLVVDGASYRVASRTSNSEIVLEDTSVTGINDETYSLEQWQVDLPSDFAAFLEPMLHYLGEDSVWHDAKGVGAAQIFRRRQQPALSATVSYPDIFAVVPLSGDRTTNQRFRLMVDPAPSAAVTLTGQYKSNPYAMTSTAPYPMGGQPHAETLVAACMAAAELAMHRRRGDHYARFLELLRDSIALDRRLTGTKSFGYNGDQSMNHEHWRERPWDRCGQSSITFPWT